MERRYNSFALIHVLYILGFSAVVGLGVSVYFALTLFWEIGLLILAVVMLLDDYIPSFFSIVAPITIPFQFLKAIPFVKWNLVLSIALFTWLKFSFELDILKLLTAITPALIGLI